MPPAAAILIGLAIAIDGDTLRIDGQPIRLWGIDAPEAMQLCTRDEQPYACGAEATVQLRAMVAGKVVACTERTRDRWQRVVAVCSVNGLDIGAAMVEAGHAVAFVRHSRDYLAQEQRAKAARAGMWGDSFEWPWNWRAQHQPGRAE